jgi:nitrogenase molybdenum-iron protein NifN
MTGFYRVAIAADPDLLVAMGQFLSGVGAQIVAAVAPSKAEVLDALPCAEVRIGDLEDLEIQAKAGDVQLLVTNSHGAQVAERLGVPLLRAGFPQYDWVGGYARTWVGYRGARQALFDLSNLFQGHHHDAQAYRSVFWADGPRQYEAPAGTRESSPVTGVVSH